MNRSLCQHGILHRLVRWMAAMLVTLLAACGGGSDDADRSTASAQLHGWAHASGPLVGARVRVLSRDGRELAVASKPTYATGTWYVKVPSLPASYTIEVTGGQDGGQPFTGTLLHTETGNDPMEPVAVNIATTLAARLQVLKPQLTDQAAVDAVRRHLALPDGVHLHRHLRHSQAYFSGAAFQAGMPTGRAFDDHVDAIAQQVGAGPARAYRNVGALTTGVAPRRTRLAVDTSLSANEAGADASQVLLASALNGPEGGAAVLGNIVIGKIFGGGDDGVLKALQKILEQLNAIDDKIDNLAVAMSALDKSVARNAYDTAVRPLGDMTADIDLMWPRYEAVVQADPTDRVHVDIARQSFLYKMSDGLTGANTGLRAYRMRQFLDTAPLILQGGGDGGTGAAGSGVLQLWNRYVLSGTLPGEKRFLSNVDQQRLAYAHSYWQMQQAKLFVMVREFAHVIADPTAANDQFELGLTKDARFFDPAWTASFLPSKVDAQGRVVTPSPAFLQQSAAAGHVAELTALPEGFLYDRAQGIVWAADVTWYPIAQRQIVTDYGTWDAVGLVSDGNGLWQFAPRAFQVLQTLSKIEGWTYPTAAQVTSLVQPTGAFSAPAGSASDKMASLRRQGFGAWIVNTDWDQWTYGADTTTKTNIPWIKPDQTYRIRHIVNLGTSEQHTSCDDVGDPHVCNDFGDDPWRLTPGGFLAVHVPAAGTRYGPGT